MTFLMSEKCVTFFKKFNMNLKRKQEKKKQLNLLVRRKFEKDVDVKVKAIPAAGVLFFSLSTSMVKSSFKNRKPMIEKR